MNKRPLLNNLPQEVLLHMFSFFKKHELVTLSAVSNNFHGLVKDPSLVKKCNYPMAPQMIEFLSTPSSNILLAGDPHLIDSMMLPAYPERNCSFSIMSGEYSSKLLHFDWHLAKSINFYQLGLTNFKQLQFPLTTEFPESKEFLFHFVFMNDTVISADVLEQYAKQIKPAQIVLIHKGNRHESINNFLTLKLKPYESLTELTTRLAETFKKMLPENIFATPPIAEQPNQESLLTKASRFLWGQK